MKLHPFLEKLVREGLEKQATDLFLVADEPPALRIKDRIERSDSASITAEQISEIARAVFSTEELESVGRETGEIHRSVALDGRMNVRLTVASCCGQNTVSVQLGGPQVASVEQIRVPQAILDSVMKLKGLVIFSGLNGSGKATTAYTVLDYVNSNVGCHICTVEDPVYVRLTPKKSLIQQREVGLDVPDGASGVRAAIAQDADVIFVSDMKSLEQMEACIAAAETGHLVIVVFHFAATPQEVVQRIAESFPEGERSLLRRALAQSLNLACSQVLLPATNGRRVAAYSVLIPDEEMREAMAEAKDVFYRRGPMPEGCQTFDDSISQLEEDGLISSQTALKAVEKLG